VNIERVPISKVIPWDKNPRGIKTKDFERLKKQIKKLGEYKPLIAYRENGHYVVLGGNMRLRAYQELGIQEVEVSIIKPKSEAQKIEYALSDNDRVGYYEEEALAELVYPYIKDIDLGEYKVDLGEPIDLKQVVERYGPDIDDGADEVPEVDDTPAVTRTGDLFTLGRHRVMCGDSTKAEDVARLMRGEKADLCFTSPPYADAREYGGSDLSVSHLAAFIQSLSPYTELFAVNLGIIRREGRVVRYWDDYIKAAEAAGLGLLSWNVWNRESAQSIAQQTAFFPIEHEWVFVFGEHAIELEKTVPNKHTGKRVGITDRQSDGTLKRRPPKVVGLMRKMGTVFTSPPNKGADIGHPAMFPVALPEAYIESVCDDNGAVCDPFLGSGTTLIAAEKLNRTCYGMEIDPKYCDVIIKRYCDYTGTDEASVRATRETRPKKADKHG